MVDLLIDLLIEYLYLLNVIGHGLVGCELCREVGAPAEGHSWSDQSAAGCAMAPSKLSIASPAQNTGAVGIAPLERAHNATAQYCFPFSMILQVLGLINLSIILFFSELVLSHDVF